MSERGRKSMPWSVKLSRSIEWPLKPVQPRKPRRTIFFILFIVLVLLLGSRTAISNWVELLWFNSLGYGEVFWKSRVLNWSVFAGFTVLTFAILYGVFAALRRAHLADLPDTHTIFVGGNPIELPVATGLRVVAVGIGALVGFATGATMGQQWPTIALFWYAPRIGQNAAAAMPVPIFGNTLSFYFFTLPE